MNIRLKEKQSGDKRLPLVYVYENDCGVYIEFDSFCEIRKGIKLKKGRLEVARLFLDDVGIQKFKNIFFVVKNILNSEEKNEEHTGFMGHNIGEKTPLEKFMENPNAWKCKYKG